MKFAQGFALAAALLGLAVASTGSNADCVKGGKETCSAEAKSSKARHYALLQVRDRLSFTSLRSTEDHEEAPHQRRHQAHKTPEQLPAENLINVKVLQEPTANLTAFDLDYLQDANNPLDGGVAAAPAGAASSTAASAGAGATPATSAEAADSTAKCCDEEKVECHACKKGLSVEGYCATHTEETGCEQIFDCTAGLERWEAGWSEIKKAYCCNKMHVGCSSASSASAAPSTSGSGSKAVTGDNWTSDYLTDGSNTSSSAGAVTSGTAAPVNKNATAPATCVTRLDPRASSVGYTSSPPGTPCIFGVDDRDENQHCIMEDGQYGSFGWCWTDVGRSSWGACSESCPLFGPIKVLGDMVKSLENKVEEAMATTVTTTTTVTNMTNTTMAPNTMAPNATSDENMTTTTQQQQTTTQQQAAAKTTTTEAAKSKDDGPKNDSSKAAKSKDDGPKNDSSKGPDSHDSKDGNSGKGPNSHDSKDGESGKGPDSKSKDSNDKDVDWDNAPGE